MLYIVYLVHTLRILPQQSLYGSCVLCSSRLVLTLLPRALVSSRHMEFASSFASSLHEVCPRSFTQMGWPIFSDEGFAFWCTYFAHLPWYDGWHIDVGRELGRRIRSHPSHDEWTDRAFQWAQESVRRELRPEATEWMRWLRRQDCNYTRYQNFRGRTVNDSMGRLRAAIDSLQYDSEGRGCGLYKGQASLSTSYE